MAYIGATLPVLGATKYVIYIHQKVSTDGPQLMLPGEVYFSLCQSTVNSKYHLSQILLYQFSLKELRYVNTVS